jgi:hypothetical protein
VFAFRRALPGDAVTVVVNVSAQEQGFTLNGRAEKLAAWRWTVATSR